MCPPRVTDDGAEAQAQATHAAAGTTVTVTATATLGVAVGSGSASDSSSALSSFGFGPDASRRQSEADRRLLHEACAAAREPAEILAIIDRHPDLMSLRNERGEIPLHAYARSACRAHFEQVARRHPPDLLLAEQAVTAGGGRKRIHSPLKGIPNRSETPLSILYSRYSECTLADAEMLGRLVMSVPSLAPDQLYGHPWDVTLPVLARAMQDARDEAGEGGPDDAQRAFLDSLTAGAHPAARAVILRALHQVTMLWMPWRKGSALSLRPPRLDREHAWRDEMHRALRVELQVTEGLSHVAPSTVAVWLQLQLGKAETRQKLLHSISDLCVSVCGTHAEAVEAAQMAERLREYAQPPHDDSLSVTPHLRLPAVHVPAGLGRPLPCPWTVAFPLSDPRALAVMVPVFFGLLRSKVSAAVRTLLCHFHAQGVFVSAWRCRLSEWSPLHVLVGEVRGCRTKLFDALVRDALPEHGGSYEALLSSQTPQGESLRHMLKRHHNRELDVEVQLCIRDHQQDQEHAQAKRNGQQTANNNEPMQPSGSDDALSCRVDGPAAVTAGPAAAAAAVAVSSDPSSSLSVPFSRRNFLTFDRVVSLDLERQLQLHSTGTPSPMDGASGSTVASASASANQSAPALAAQPALAPRLLAQSPEAAALGVYQMDDLLSREECARLIGLTTAQDSLAAEYLLADRDSTRLLCRSPGLARALYARLAAAGVVDVLRREHPARRPMGFGTFGLWEPEGLNSCFRFSAYGPGSGGFAPHRDAAFVESPDLRSVWTLLIYLTEDEGAHRSRPESLSQTEPQAESDADADSDRDGATRFFVPTVLVKGGTIEEERIRPYLCVRPAVGRALLFPHELIHSGGPLSSLARSSKYVVRTDLLYRRATGVPMGPLERNWRNDADYLRSVELFQMAFKHEIAGRLKDSSECYVRCSALRAWPLVVDQHKQMQRSQAISGQQLQKESGTDSDADPNPESSRTSGSPSLRRSPAVRMAADCVRVVLSFLDSDSRHAAASTCLRWWAAAPRTHSSEGELRRVAAGLAVHMQTSRARCSESDGEDSWQSPPQAQSLSLSSESSFPPLLLRPSPVSRARVPVLRVLPRVHEVGGIVCHLSYPLGFYRRHGPRCRRVMAVYAALTFSHHLPPVAPAKEHDTRATHVDPDSDASALLSTRCVLSYGGGSGPVMWTTFGRLIGAVFTGDDVAAWHSTLDEMNRTEAPQPQPRPRPSRADADGASSCRPASHAYGFGERLLAASGGSTRRRYCVGSRGLLPSFYHAWMCCRQHWAAESDPTVRHELSCELKWPMLARKRARQKEARRAQIIGHAKELRAVDEGMLAAATAAQVDQEATVPARSAAPASAGSAAPWCSHASPPPPPPCTVIVQEMQSAGGWAHFRVSFIGVSCM